MELTAQTAALYLGQKFQTPDGVGALVGVYSDGIVKIEFGAFGPDFVVSHTLPFVKPILRRIESLTEAEARELYEVQNEGWYWVEEGSAVEHFFGGFDLDEGELLCGSKVWLKLLSWGFDLLGLIDAGVAIDAATIETKTV